MEINHLLRKIVKVSDVYADKNKIDRNQDWYLLKLQEELGELTQQHLKLSQQGHTEGTPEEHRKLLEEEVADVFAHILLYAHNNNIDVEKVVKDKWFSWLER